MKIIDTQNGRCAKIDNVHFAGFDNFEHLAYFHRGLSVVLQDFVENALKDGGYPEQTVCDIAFAMQGHKNTTDYLLSCLVGHIHSLEDELGLQHDVEIDVATDCADDTEDVSRSEKTP